MTFKFKSAWTRDEANEPSDPMSAFLGWLRERLDPNDMAEAGRMASRMAEHFARANRTEAGAEDLKRRVRDGALRRAHDAAMSLDSRFPALARISKG